MLYDQTQQYIHSREIVIHDDFKDSQLSPYSTTQLYTFLP